MIEPVTQLAFSIVENPGIYALLIGSGVSRAAEIPTGWEIILDLSRRLAIAEGIENETDWAAWYRNRFGSEPNYSTLLDKLSMLPAERRSILHNYIEASAEDFAAGRRVPTKAHRAIANLVRDDFIKVIITTNFDRLLESALREVGVEPTVIKSVDDISGAIPITHSRCYIIKLHGDYLDNRILNTDAELLAYQPELNQQLDRIFDEYGLIVSGWSGDWDPALRTAIMRAPNRRYPIYWAARGEPTTLAQDIISQRKARVIQVEDANIFFEKLQKSVETLHRSRRVHPDAIELLLASVKRFVARHEHRIELHDLISDEVNRLQQRIHGGDFPVQMANVTWDVIRTRWDAMEALAEPLARAMGLLGRWGEDSDLGLAQDCLRALIHQPARSGNTALLALSTYPAYLCFLTYALGLTKAARFETLLQWFQTELASGDRSPREAVNSLFLLSWRDANTDLWKQRRPEYSNNKTPWADYLFDFIVPWSRDYGLTAEQARENYNTTELLGGFAALIEHNAEDLNAITDFIRMPYGRLMWSEVDREKTLSRLEAAATKASLLAAGFSNGSESHWNGVKRNIQFLSRRIGW